MTEKNKNAASVKARLLNISRETGKTFQEYLILYGLERTIYRISVSDYADNFTLKGGIFLYAVFDGDFARATTDIDLLATSIDNDTEYMRTVFTDIFSLDGDDPVRFDLDSLEVKSITEFKEYHGVSISIMGYLERTRLPVSIDIGFGDIIYPGRIKMDFPVVLSSEPPEVYAYSIYSCLAEKFEAIVSLGYDNSRFKDFYDIYAIASSQDFEGALLLDAVRETFHHRHTHLDDIVAFEADFCNDRVRQSRWKAFVKKKKALIYVNLEEAINIIRLIFTPVIASFDNADYTINRIWQHELMDWKDL